MSSENYYTWFSDYWGENFNSWKIEHFSSVRGYYIHKRHPELEKKYHANTEMGTALIHLLQQVLLVLPTKVTNKYCHKALYLAIEFT